MISGRSSEDKYLDYKAVCNICGSLLNLGSANRPQTSLQIAAEDFSKAPLGTGLDELLDVSTASQYNLSELTKL